MLAFEFASSSCERCAAQPDVCRGLPCPSCWGRSQRGGRGRHAGTGLLLSMLPPGAVAAFGRSGAGGYDEPWARAALAREAAAADGASLAVRAAVAAFESGSAAAASTAADRHPSVRAFEFRPGDEKLGFVYYDPIAAGEPPAIGSCGNAQTGAAAAAAASGSAAAAEGDPEGRPWKCHTCGGRFANNDDVLYGGRAAAAALRARLAEALPLENEPGSRAGAGDRLTIPGLSADDLLAASKGTLGFERPLPELLLSDSSSNQAPMRIDVACAALAMAVDRKTADARPEDLAEARATIESALALVAGIVGPRHAATKLLQLQALRLAEQSFLRSSIVLSPHTQCALGLGVPGPLQLSQAELEAVTANWPNAMAPAGTNYALSIRGPESASALRQMAEARREIRQLTADTFLWADRLASRGAGGERLLQIGSLPVAALWPSLTHLVGNSERAWS